MDTIEHLEYLSKLKFSDEERKKFEKEFENILSFVNEITSLEVPDDIEKDKPVKMSALRPDEAKPSMAREEVLQNAPKQKDGCYSTPLVVD